MHWNIGSNNLLNISLSHQLNISAAMKAALLWYIYPFFFPFKRVSDIWHVLIELFPTKTKLSSLSYSLVWKLRLWALSRELRDVEVFNFPDSEKNCTICPCVVMLGTLGLWEGGIGWRMELILTRDWLSFFLCWPLSVWEVLSVEQWSPAYLVIPRVHNIGKHCISHAHSSSRDDDPLL